MITPTLPPVTTKDSYLRDGKAYARVTSVLNAFSGKDGGGSAAAMMTGQGLRSVMRDLSFGDIHPGLQDHYQDLAGFFAEPEGAEFVAHRYYAELGRYADMGTLVDLAMRPVLERLSRGESAGFFSSERDAQDWIDAEIAAINVLRKETAQEYAQAKEARDFSKTKEVGEKPRFPVAIDREDAARRILMLQDWHDANEVKPMAWQQSLYCDHSMVAGTPDLIAHAPDSPGQFWVIDYKTSSKNKPEHAAQVVKYADMWDQLGAGRVVRATVVYATSEKVQAYDVKDWSGARELFDACHTCYRMKTLFGRVNVPHQLVASAQMEIA